MLINRNIKTQNINAVYHFIIGLMFGGMTAWVVITSDKKPKGIDQFDWIYIIIFGVFSLFFILKGLRSIFSRAFMVVDEDKISVKPDESSKTETIYWKNIASLKEMKNNFEVIFKDGTHSTIYLSYFNTQHANDLKVSIQSMAKEKGISIEPYVSTKYINQSDED